MALLSIHSSVISGHVGNSAAAFPIQCMGIEFWQIPTVLLSNHPGHGRFTGQAVDAVLLERLVDGLAMHGALDVCRGVLTGYFSAVEQVDAAVQAIRHVRSISSQAAILCDPVLGDEGKGLYVPQTVAEAVRDTLVSEADILTPNAFELGWLAAMPTETVEQAAHAADALRSSGPDKILVTSLPGERPDETIGMLLVEGRGHHFIETPRLPISLNGAGDLAAALFLAHLTLGTPAIQALEKTVSTIFAVVERTVALGRNELAILDCATLYANPQERFSTRTLDLVR